MNRLFRLKQDNRGSAIIMALVGLAFIITLVTTMYSVTLANVHMKNNDLRIKRSYYTAETVAEQIRAGLEDKSSEAFTEIFRRSLSEYNTGASFDAMKETYFSKLVKSLGGDPAASPITYNVEELRKMAYLEGFPKDGQPWELYSVEGEPPVLEKKEDRMILKNVHIRFTNTTDHTVSEIKTDYALNAPSGSFTTPQVPNLFDYAIVARSDFIVKNGTNLISSKSIYAGDESFQIGDGTGNASLTMNKNTYLISKAPLKLKGQNVSSTRLVTMDNTRFYTQEIDLDNASIEIGGVAAVADDLVFSGAGKATIGTVKTKKNPSDPDVYTGVYIGYGNGYSLDDPDNENTTKEAKSSAVLINHKHATLDASKAENFVLAGYAYVGQDTGSEHFGYKLDTANPVKAEVPMARSIAVKSDQIAYLIPPELIGVVKRDSGLNNETIVGMNPVLNYNDADGFSGYYDPSVGGTLLTVDFDTELENLGGHNLGYFADSKAADGKKYIVRYVQKQYGQNMAYFYLPLSDGKNTAGIPLKDEFLATDYAKNYVNKDFFTFYVSASDSILLNDKAQIAGSYVTTDGDDKYREHVPDPDAVPFGSSSDYQYRYKALCAKMIENYAGLSPEEQAEDRNIFSNLVDEETLEDYFALSPGTTVFVYPDPADPDNKKNKGIVTKGNYAYDGSDQKIHFILCTGDVEVTGNFSGVILAKGKITVSGGDIRFLNDYSQPELSALISTTTILDTDGTTEKTSEGGKAIYNFLRNGELYKTNLGSAEGGALVDTSEHALYSSLVHYENFEKR